MELENALQNTEWDIIGLAEIRHNYEAQNEMKKGYILMHSAADNGQFGTGFIIKKPPEK